MKTEAEFKRFFQTELLGDLNELENTRLKIAGKVKILLVCVLIIFIGLILYIFWLQPARTGTKPEFDPVRIFWVILSLVILGIIFSLGTAKFSKKFRNVYKEVIIRRIIGGIGKDISYLPDDKIDLNEFKNSGIFNDRISNYTGRDLIGSKIGDITYRFSWLNVDSIRYSTTSARSGRTSMSHTSSETYQIFQGIFFVADFGAKFQAEAVIWPNFSNKFRLGAIGDLFQNAMVGNRLTVEDPIFEKVFAVYGRDLTAVKQILTPGFRQWMIDFRAKTNSLLYLSFKETKLNVAVRLKKQLFDPRIFKNVTDYNFIFENFQYLMLFNGLLEDLGKRH
jgi:hypothetical protein